MLHRYGSTAKHLALRLLALSPGDRLDSIGDLAEAFGTGRGTVQSALKLLQEENALVLINRKRRGTFLKEMNQAKLLELAGLSPIMGVMAVPYSLRFQGLATGLARGFEAANLPLVLAHLRGGKNRLHFLRTGRCDFAVISRLAWEEESQHGDLHLVQSYGPGSNVGDHVLILRSSTPEEITDGMRVGVDSSSYDYMRLTLAECQGKAVSFVEMSYGQTVPKLLASEIDAALWDAGVALPAELPLTLRPRRNRTPEGDLDTEAVLVTRTDASALGDLLRHRIDPTAVVAVQRRVLTGEELPVF